MNNLIVHINRTSFLDMESKEYKEQYAKNIASWAVLKDERTKLTEDIITNMMKLGIDFWCHADNLNPYNTPNMILISLSLNYIGTNKFYGYVTKDFYNNLLKTFEN